MTDETTTTEETKELGDVLREISLESMFDDELGDVQEIGFWAMRLDGPFNAETVFHVAGLPGEGFTWQTEPLLSLANDFGSFDAAERLARNLKTSGIVPEPKIQTLEPSEDSKILAEEAGLSAGIIYQTDEQGFRDWTVYVSKSDLDAAWAKLQDEETDRRGPQEEDATIYPSGPLGSRTTATFGTDVLGEFRNDDDGDADTKALRAIWDAMTEADYFPNVWSVSDHGNAHLIKDLAKQIHEADAKDAREIADALEECVDGPYDPSADDLSRAVAMLRRLAGREN